MTSPTAAPVVTPFQDVAVVVIGRNEGERLQQCLRSLAGTVAQIVYVDSGSTDGSANAAAEAGAHVIALDMTTPFTAARARNTGWQHVAKSGPAPLFVQFVDGDCEVRPGWLETARAYLRQNPKVAVAFGRRKERYPERSVYNRLCDIEWNVPAGEVLSCGGDAMMRFDALRDAGGYRDSLIAGEEPELCVRLRRAGWKVVSLASPMTLHDAAMTRFGQWWTRTVRAGYAFAEGSHLHGGPPEFHWLRETRRAALWGLAIPAVTAALTLALGPLALALLLVYPAQIARLYLKRRKVMDHALLVSIFNVVARFPEAVGVAKFRYDLLTGRKRKLIEYK